MGSPGGGSSGESPRTPPLVPPSPPSNNGFHQSPCADGEVPGFRLYLVVVGLLLLVGCCWVAVGLLVGCWWVVGGLWVVGCRA